MCVNILRTTGQSVMKVIRLYLAAALRTQQRTNLVNTHDQRRPQVNGIHHVFFAWPCFSTSAAPSVRWRMSAQSTSRAFLMPSGMGKACNNALCGEGQWSAADGA